MGEMYITKNISFEKAVSVYSIPEIKVSDFYRFVSCFLNAAFNHPMMILAHLTAVPLQELIIPANYAYERRHAVLRGGGGGHRPILYRA